MIGALKNRLRLQEKIRTPDGGGGYAESWDDVTASPAVFARVEALSGTSGFYARQKIFYASHRVTIRWRGDVTTEMRLTDGARHYEVIQTRDPTGRQEYLEIYALETLPA